MICTNGLFTSDQWIVFNRYNITVPVEGEKYTIRATIQTKRGTAYLLNEIVNPKIPNETPDAEGTDFYYEPTFAAWRFKEESEVLENVLQLEAT